MPFYLYIFFSLILIAGLLIFDLTFGLSIIKGVPFAVSKPNKIKQMINLLKNLPDLPQPVKALDIGSGDGRIVLKLAQAGFQATGLEINTVLVIWSRWRLKHAKVQATIKRQDFWQADFSRYNVVTLFGVFYIMAKLEQKLLAELPSGAIVICNHYTFPTWPLYQRHGDVFIYKKD